MDLHTEATAFFDAFVTAFHAFDGTLIAKRYTAPYLALNADGELRCFTDHADIAGYFQSVVDDYHAQGCRNCRFADLDIVPLGSRSMMATVSWELLHEDGSVLNGWRESYTLTRERGRWRVMASVDHLH